MNSTYYCTKIEKMVRRTCRRTPGNPKEFKRTQKTAKVPKKTAAALCRALAGISFAETLQ
jgi:hypothetical protein